MNILLNSFIPCVIFQIKACLGCAVMLCNLRCSSIDGSPQEQCALLHTPGHVASPLLLQGVAGAGPGAGGGAELLTAGLSFSIIIISLIVAATGEEAGLGVVLQKVPSEGS